MDKQKKHKEILHRDKPETELALNESNLSASLTNKNNKKIKSEIIRYKNADSIYE